MQAQILDLLQEQQRERFMAMILVTHDLGVVAGRTDDIAVMYAGRVVEKAPTRTLFTADPPPVHRGAAAIDPEADRAEPLPPRHHHRPPARHRRPAPGVQVRAPLPLRPGACVEEEPPLLDAETPGHEYRCWIPVGTPENRAALAANQQAGVTSAMAMIGSV